MIKIAIFIFQNSTYIGTFSMSYALIWEKQNQTISALIISIFTTYYSFRANHDVQKNTWHEHCRPSTLTAMT